MSAKQIITLILSWNLFLNSHEFVSEDPDTENFQDCPEFISVEYGTVNVNTIGDKKAALISCDDGYDLNGNANIYCENGQWDDYALPLCIKRCQKPPYIDNGFVSIEGKGDDQGFYRKGTLVTYSCRAGYALSPSESKYRVCEKGIWTGPSAACIPIVEKINACLEPKQIANGYFVPEISEKNDNEELYGFGQRLHYSCKTGYMLYGTRIQQCLDDGTWSPKIQPECLPQATDSSDDYPCHTLPYIPHSTQTVVHGSQIESEESVIDGTVIEIRCNDKYKNSRAPCQPAKLKCIRGSWIGDLPYCVPATECPTPPEVPYATIVNENIITFEPNAPTKFPIESQIVYKCLPGYVPEGNTMMYCSMGGCWLPKEPPACIRGENNYYLEMKNLNAILISAATGAGVLGILMLICLYVVCRKRKPVARSVPISAPIQRQDHTALLHHPDRLALIAFADGMQAGSQSSLPTYDEATRERGPGLTVNRLHRPHWPNLAGRRSRNSPNPDIVHVTRHGSFASHTPSTRSGGDSMGSTDTMAVSEGSTIVTLDTASSHSGSQPASCRAHCGSLASFDTSSVINNEDVPLLEENELEEVQAVNDISTDQTIVANNPSFKFPSTDIL